MGTINYCTSDYITLGIKPYDIDDFINDSEYVDYMQHDRNIDISDREVLYKAIYDDITNYYDDDIENVKNELRKYDFYYYHIKIKPGYYEGFTIDIENNYSIAHDDYISKKEAQKEITQIKSFLMECAGLGLVACYPGWCTGYSDYAGTLAEIKNAIKEMRLEVKATSTFSQYNRG